MKIKNIFKNIKIGKKLTLAFLLVTLISSISGIIGFAVMTSMNGQYSRAFVNYGFSQGDIGMFNTEFNNNLIIVRDMIIQTDSTQMLKSKKQLDQSNTKLSQYLTKMQTGMVNAKEKGYYNTIRDSMTDYAMARDQAVQLAISNQDQEAYQTLSDNCTPLSDKIRSAIDALVIEKTSTGNQISKSLNMRSRIADGIMFGVLLLAMVLSVTIAVLISRGISKPVSELVTAANRMAQGDLAVKINVKSKDEIGQLGFAFMKTIEILNTYITDIKTKLAKVEKGDLTVARDFEYKGDFVELINSIEAIVAFMNDTVTQMRQAAQQVAGGSEQVSSGAQALAQGATLQASSIEQLSATTTEITTDLKENAEQVTKVSVSVNDVSSEIETCNQHMRQMVQAMTKIDDSSNKIGAIIKTIEDIAFQTNILALNAAVEAARAGEAGKGFAVVADEVRNLASRSATAAKDTTLLIQNSIGEVENGTKITNETAEILIRVVENARAVSDMVNQISQATTKQADAIQQINSGVEQISNVIQTNSATAEESAAASEELAEQAQTMKSLSEKFKLRECN